MPLFAILFIVAGTGCDSGYETATWYVGDASTHRPIAGAKVWEQPYAPLHPFWPKGDSGVTDGKGQVRLRTPTSYYFYFGGAEADGYEKIPFEDGVDGGFYLKRTVTPTTRR